jgi:urease accessory protein
MSAVTSPYEPTVDTPSGPSAGMHGRAAVRLANQRGQTTLAALHQTSPLRVLFPDAADGDPFTAAVVTTSGGLVGGDSLAIDLAVDAGASGLFVSQAAEKIYRSTAADSRIDVFLRAATGSWLEFLPQETILFDDARLRRRTVIEATPGARLLAGEILIFGRTARGERMNHGLIHDAWQVRRAGRLVWADALHIDGDIAARLDDPAGFGGCHATATMALVTDDPAPFLAVLRASRDFAGVRFGATIVNGVLLTRWLGTDGEALRRSFGAAWGELRAAAVGYPRSLPRLWAI